MSHRGRTRRALSAALASMGAVLALAGAVAWGGPQPRPPKPRADAPVDQAANAGCYVCHIAFVKETISRTHVKAGVGCTRCHGVSARHANDEHVGATKPDRVYRRGQVNALCRSCHPSHNVAPEKMLAVYRQRQPAGSPIGGASTTVCTDCHGAHRIAAAATPGTTPTGRSSMDTTMGVLSGLGSLPLLTDARTRSISAENPTGAKGRGAMAVPNPADPNPPASARAADSLGQGWKVRPFIRINKHETATLMDVNGPGVIRHIWLVEGLNRALVLRAYWDGEATPSIETPAPDFFAVGHGRFARVNSLPVTVNPANAMSCFWPMPFRKHARITLTNESDRDVELVAFQITYSETPVPPEAGYLHAQYRRAGTEKQNPYIILNGVRGKGRYVGTFLAWTQFTKGWFGEGEIKFFIDGDNQFPTICGTGTEDYFLGSYGFPEPFSTAYSGTVLASSDGAEPPTHWSLYRWHIQDPIDFGTDLRVTIQALGWGPDGKYRKMADDIASVAYWYQSEPHAPYPALPSAAERLRDGKAP